MEARSNETAIQIRLLGRFEVVVGERRIDGASWPSMRSAQLVQLLALADGLALARDQVIEALWPHLDADAGAANLRKAAHHARRALGAPDAVVLRRGQVALFPDRAVSTDVAQFMIAADTALAGHDPDGWRVAAASYGGELLPDSLYEEWTQAPRRALRSRYVEVLRQGRRVGAARGAGADRRTGLSRADGRGDGRRQPSRRRCNGTDGCAQRCCATSPCCPAHRPTRCTRRAWPGSASPTRPSSDASSSWHASPQRFGATAHRRRRYCSFGVLPASASRPSASSWR